MSAEPLLQRLEAEKAAPADWLAEQRQAAVADMLAAGVPHRRNEAWKYTDLRQVLAKHDLGTLAAPAGRVEVASAFDDLPATKLVFANGILRDTNAADLPDGVDLVRLPDASTTGWAKALVGRGRAILPQTGFISDLSLALGEDGVLIRVKAGVRLTKPLMLLYSDEGDGLAATRSALLLEEGASAELYEMHLGTGAATVSHSLRVKLAPGARLTHTRVQQAGADQLRLGAHDLDLEAGASYTQLGATTGAAVSRQQTQVRFLGEGASASLRHATALRGRQHADHYAVLDHQVPGCSSEAVFKTVLDDEATGVFQGRALVAKDAQKSDARQLTKALLLSREATMYAKPELEIYADDVQCAHGSTIGELDRNALFYLRSRGIPEARARALLISAFLADLFEEAPEGPAAERLKGLTEAWFTEARHTEGGQHG